MVKDGEMMKMAELIKWIKSELPPDGEWWSGGALEFEICAREMRGAGLKIEHIKKILQRLYTAVSAEYGG